MSRKSRRNVQSSRKVVVKTKPDRRIALLLPLTAVVLTVFMVLLVLLVRQNQEQSTIPESFACGDQVPLPSVYPPDFSVTASQQDWAVWESGHKESNYYLQAVWIVEQLLNSRMPIAHETGEFFLQHQGDIKLRPAIGMEAKTGLHGETTTDQEKPESGLIVIYLDQNMFDGPDTWSSLEISNIIVHESVHARELLARAQKLEAGGLTRVQALQAVSNQVSTNRQLFLCGEMEATAYQTAYYAQLQRPKYTAKIYQKEFLWLRDHNWDWHLKSWLDVVQQDYDLNP
jgi:hypothetical protein